MLDGLKKDVKVYIYDRVDLSLELLMEKDVLIEQMEKYDYAIDSLRRI